MDQPRVEPVRTRSHSQATVQSRPAVVSYGHSGCGGPAPANQPPRAEKLTMAGQGWRLLRREAANRSRRRPLPRKRSRTPRVRAPAEAVGLTALRAAGLSRAGSDEAPPGCPAPAPPLPRQRPSPASTAGAAPTHSPRHSSGPARPGWTRPLLVPRARRRHPSPARALNTEPHS